MKSTVMQVVLVSVVTLSFLLLMAATARYNKAVISDRLDAIVVTPCIRTM